jgi:dienelactone hydrolase
MEQTSVGPRQVRASGSKRHAPRRPGGAATVGNWAARAILALCGAIGAATSLLPWGRAAARGLLLLPPLLTASQPVAFVVMGEQMRHTQLTVPSANGTVYLDVYAPVSPPPPILGTRGGMLLIPGVGDNRSIPQLINLSTSLARTGTVVMEMTTPTLIAYDLSPADSDAVVQAFDRLANWPGVGRGRVGIVGFSGGGPLACLAAVDPRIRDRVAFITSFGGYYDVRDMLRDFGRHAIDVGGRLQPWRPDPVPVEVLANVLAHRLPAPDGARLAAAFAFDQATPLTPYEVAQLSPPGKAAYHLLAGDDPTRADANIATLLPVAGDLLAQLSPSSVVSQIRAPIYLLHDRGDPSIPVTETRHFDAALTRLHHPHDYAEFGIFAHTQVRSGLTWGPLITDGARLGRILYELLLVGS